jgi:hypothetical protein
MTGTSLSAADLVALEYTIAAGPASSRHDLGVSGAIWYSCVSTPRTAGENPDARGQVNAAGAALDDDQRVEALEQHGVHLDEADRDNTAGLVGQELLPGRARAAGAGPIPASCRICHIVWGAISVLAP